MMFFIKNLFLKGNENIKNVLTVGMRIVKK
ncbi:hypothetical protein SAMN05444955_10173 [Lihuaxuella thermophila]|uniref:Uncharacterized protein n=1 Tax=Lihuaxuella thermophila TaxID=1173111 RepID=A0A1H8AD09_9BACL|nr:hypothetical protein SAMN05444955_10173 [Lihuaxuella thermophila]